MVAVLEIIGTFTVSLVVIQIIGHYYRYVSCIVNLFIKRLLLLLRLMQGYDNIN